VVKVMNSVTEPKTFQKTKQSQILAADQAGE
jgi:hypothetical protein